MPITAKYYSDCHWTSPKVCLFGCAPPRIDSRDQAIMEFALRFKWRLARASLRGISRAGHFFRIIWLGIDLGQIISPAAPKVRIGLQNHIGKTRPWSSSQPFMVTYSVIVERHVLLLPTEHKYPCQKQFYCHRHSVSDYSEIKNTVNLSSIKLYSCVRH